MSKVIRFDILVQKSQATERCSGDPTLWDEGKLTLNNSPVKRLKWI